MVKKKYDTEHLDSDTQTASSFTLAIKTDVDCVFFIDGEAIIQLIAGLWSEYPLSPGEYTLKFVGVDDDASCLEKVFVMPAENTSVEVKLLAKSKENQSKRVAKDTKSNRLVQNIQQKHQAAIAKQAAEQQKMAAVIRKAGELSERGGGERDDKPQVIPKPQKSKLEEIRTKIKWYAYGFLFSFMVVIILVVCDPDMEKVMIPFVVFVLVSSSCLGVLVVSCITWVFYKIKERKKN